MLTITIELLHDSPSIASLALESLRHFINLCPSEFLNVLTNLVSSPRFNLLFLLHTKETLHLHHNSLSFNVTPSDHDSAESWVYMVCSSLIKQVSQIHKCMAHFQFLFASKYFKCLQVVPLLLLFDPALLKTFSLIVSSAVKHAADSKNITHITKSCCLVVIHWILSVCNLYYSLTNSLLSLSLNEHFDLEVLARAAFNVGAYFECVQILEYELMDKNLKSSPTLCQLLFDCFSRISDQDAIQGVPLQHSFHLFGSDAINLSVLSGNSTSALVTLNGSSILDPAVLNSNVFRNIGMDNVYNQLKGSSASFLSAIKLGDWRSIDSLEINFEPNVSTIGNQDPFICMFNEIKNFKGCERVFHLCNQKISKYSLEKFSSFGPFCSSLETFNESVIFTVITNICQSNNIDLLVKTLTDWNPVDSSLIVDVFCNYSMVFPDFAYSAVQLLLRQCSDLLSNNSVSQAATSLAKAMKFVEHFQNCDWYQSAKAQLVLSEVSLLNHFQQFKSSNLLISSFLNGPHSKSQIEESIFRAKLFLELGKLDVLLQPNSLSSSILASQNFKNFQSSIDLLSPLQEEPLMTKLDPVRELAMTFHCLATESLKLFNKKNDWLKAYASKVSDNDMVDCVYTNYAATTVSDIANLRKFTFDYFCKSLKLGLPDGIAIKSLVTVLSLLLETINLLKNNNSASITLSVGKSDQDQIFSNLMKIPVVQWSKFSMMLVTNITTQSSNSLINFPPRNDQKDINYTSSPCSDQIASDYDRLLTIYTNIGTLLVRAKKTKSASGLSSSIRNVLSRSSFSSSNIPVLTTINPLGSARFGHNFPVFSAFSDEVKILSGINMPIKISIIDSSGIVHHQLIKHGNDDLRDAAGIQQTIEVLNSLLGNDKSTRDRNLKFVTYCILPISISLGVIEFIPDTVSFGGYLKDAHARYRPHDLSCSEARGILRKSHDRSKKDNSVLLKDFSSVCQRFLPVFRYFFLENYVTATEWYNKRKIYTQSVAVTSIVSYLVGIGDRHAENILIDTKSANVIHIDLEYLFDSSKNLKVPEVVPFRLTRDMVDGFGVTKTEGVFTVACEKVLSLCRQNHLLFSSLSSLVLLSSDTQFKVFHRNPADHMASVRTAVQELIGKLTGIQDGVQITVPAHIQMLIDDATSFENLSRMFPGWSPFM
ncbi:hypothetical protein GEMRC1_007746 [Eukaryota sp. GEM-RC1]